MKHKDKPYFSFARHFLAKLILVVILIVSVGINICFFIQTYRRNMVTYVVDGDSFELADGRRVRLLGVDAPEKGRCGYEEAKAKLSALLLGNHVRLDNRIPDAYGRVLATVFAKNILINKEVIRFGSVKNTGSNTTYNSEFSRLENDAKVQKLGIYSNQCRGSSPQSECTIKGNIRQGKKAYYVSGCKTYDQVIVDLSFGDAWFCTEQDAIQQGFTKAMSCL